MTTTPLPPLPPEDFIWFDPEYGDMPVAHSSTAMQAYAQQARADLEAENKRLREALEGVLKIGRGTSGRIIIEGWQEEVIRAALKGSNHD